LATFDEFYASLDPDFGVRGKQFEKFVKWFLKTDPTWSSQIDEVWLWNEYPKRWGADCGIDLIFTHKNGNTWAVQSKCISPNNDIKKSEIDSFLSESSDSKIDGRLLIASTDGIGKNAQQVINRQEKQVVCFLLEQFRQSLIDYPSSMEDLNQGKRKKKKDPRPYQRKAINSVFQGLKTASRGQVLMACGTGKTLTSLWIKEKLKAVQVLVLLPSLSLLSQTLKEWNAESRESFKWICVCSDSSVAKDKTEDQWISNTSAIGVPVTSQPLEIKHFLDESGSKVVFSTYQSAKLIVEAQEHHDTSEFDLVIADEAHRCAGRVSDFYGLVLDENKIKATNRLFFTATPRFLSKHIKRKSFDMDFEIASMDDPSLFGEVFYQLKFSEAIKNDLLSDYQVVVIGVDDAMIKQKILNRELIKVDDETILDAEMIASQIAVIKAIKEYDLNRIITFHSRIKKAKDFANSFEQVIKHMHQSEVPSMKVCCNHISGGMKTSERNQKLYQLKNLEVDERRILTNARCLSEGVDVPSLSGIVFIDPRQSQIDIIQAVGRAIRKSDNKSKGTIVIPLYLHGEETLEEAVVLSNFQKVWQIVIALKSQDDGLMECIDKLRIEKGFKGKISAKNAKLDQFVFDIPQKITEKFTKSIQTLLVENASDNWFEVFGELKNYHAKHKKIPSNQRVHKKLGGFVDRCRQAYKANKLNEEQISLLESIDNWHWGRKFRSWEVIFNEVREYSFKYKKLPTVKSQPALGYWCGRQRSAFRQNKLSEGKIKLLNSIDNWIWVDNNSNYSKKNASGLTKDNISNSSKKNASGLTKDNISNTSKEIHLDNWFQVCEELKNYVFKYKKIPSNNRVDKKLGGFVTKCRQAYKANKLNEEQISCLESIDNWHWGNTLSSWDARFNELKEYIFNYKKLPTVKSHPVLGYWCGRQRSAYRNQKLSESRIELLNSLDYWKW